MKDPETGTEQQSREKMAIVTIATPLLTWVGLNSANARTRLEIYLLCVYHNTSFNQSHNKNMRREERYDNGSCTSKNRSLRPIVWWPLCSFSRLGSEVESPRAVNIAFVQYGQALINHFVHLCLIIHCRSTLSWNLTSNAILFINIKYSN